MYLQVEKVFHVVKTSACISMYQTDGVKAVVLTLK